MTASVLTYVSEVCCGEVFWMCFSKLITSQISPLALHGLVTGLCNVSFCIGPFVCGLIENSIATRTDWWAYRGIFVAQWGFGVSFILIAPFAPEQVWSRLYYPVLTHRHRSPWWLIGKEREEAALESLWRLGHFEFLAEEHLAVMKINPSSGH
jgi:MFS family permease